MRTSWCLVLSLAVSSAVANELVVTVSDVEVPEVSTNAQFIISLSAPQQDPVAVSFTTFQLPPSANVPYPAQSGVDYVATNGTVIFAPGETFQSVLVPILDDEVNEAIEPFGFGLTGTSNGTVGPSARCNIVDSDVMEMWFNEPTVFEGHAGNASVEVTLSTSRPTEQALRGKATTFNLTDGTASASDYYKTGGWWSGVPPGPARTNLFVATVQVFGDEENEEDETFYVNVTWDAARNVTLRAPGRCTILNDDFRLQSARGASNRVALVLTGASGAVHVLQWSTNLVNWTSFATNVVGPGRTNRQEVATEGDRFFRAQRQIP